MFLTLDDKTDGELTVMRNNIEKEELDLISRLSMVQDKLRTVRYEQSRRFRKLIQGVK